jgi:hypothetical protein
LDVPTAKEAVELLFGELKESIKKYGIGIFF